MKGGNVMGIKEYLGLLVGLCYCFLFAMIFCIVIDQLDLWPPQVFVAIFILMISFSGVYVAESFTNFLYHIEDKRKRD